ncbi:hypothetical protein [Kitasatospora sp. DSM 101779]|uniref:hypothetical protein n=1 Tax=Kitasatospora sp. DSM 101779 TaxID=2853165 RepID=UPI0021DAA2BF|nr:hypothetical protein [Kitasatospora sp. DSM 101779]MCU7824044.1 hypothetical protein [Kitasatospora sp. DSM 101779]
MTDEQPARRPPGATAGPDRAFWDGDFTLRADGDDRPAAPALDPLGPSGRTVRGRDLADLLAPAYRRFTGAD